MEAWWALNPGTTTSISPQWSRWWRRPDTGVWNLHVWLHRHPHGPRVGTVVIQGRRVTGNKLGTAPGLLPSLFFICPRISAHNPHGRLGHPWGPPSPLKVWMRQAPHCLRGLGQTQKGLKDLKFWDLLR